MTYSDIIKAKKGVRRLSYRDPLMRKYAVKPFVPAEPNAVTLTAVSDTQINLTWQNPEVS